ncbi:MAG TPA: hypothetical protein VFP95_01995 [Gammaproteobacteria bacterium]|nr:hypothetical protein [Gammaproteobacteria bacterium]
MLSLDAPGCFFIGSLRQSVAQVAANGLWWGAFAPYYGVSGAI